MSTGSLAGLSVDVDSVASHLEGYGHDRPPDDGKAYRVAVPRILDVLDRCGARCTFFLIAEEAREHPETVRALLAAGHEVASHSLTHRLPFSNLTPSRLHDEVDGSKTLLESIADSPIHGFRAPSWDATRALLSAVRDAGYRYDASAYPSILLPLLRRSVARRSARKISLAGASAWSGVFGPTSIHQVLNGDAVLWEVPTCTAPVIRLPYYHTMEFVLPRPLFAGLGRLARSRRQPITYQFHAVDFLGLGEDDLDPRIGVHPGMRVPLDAKLRRAARAVRDLAGTREVVPLIDVVDRVELELEEAS